MNTPPAGAAEMQVNNLAHYKPPRTCSGVIALVLAVHQSLIGNLGALIPIAVNEEPGGPIDVECSWHGK
ncbi:MAG TPA: hypothetical protein P5114_08095 [Hyphomicrobiaceae bacterium]|nr:hypothetical protein [Hyphomicrobiaceae bacterium]